MSDKPPVVLVTRKLPDAVEDRLGRDYQARLNSDDALYSKDELIEMVWDGRIVSDGTLNTRINSVRRAVGDDGKRQAVIKTFPRRGFRFVAEVTEKN